MDLPFPIPTTNSIASPADVYIDREDEVKTVIEFLKQDHQLPQYGNVCVIHGLPGVGKTELCQVVVDRIPRAYFDAQVYIKVGKGDVGDRLLYKVFEILIHLFSPLARLSDDLAILNIQYLTELIGKKVLIVLDDLQNTDNLALLVPPLSCTLLITAKRSLDIPNALSLQLVGLSQENSEALLTTICPRLGGYTSAMARVCRRNPLYLRLIAGLLSENTDLAVDHCLRALEARLIQTDVAEDDSVADRLVSFVFENIHPTQPPFVLQLGIIPDGFREALVLELAQTISNGDNNSKTAKAKLETAVRLNFLAYDPVRQYYRMPATIQEFALNRFEDSSSAWFSFVKVYADLVGWFTSLGNRNADGFLLSISVFDEHKSTVKTIYHYLLEHSDPSLDEIKLELFSLVHLFGQCRFLARAEMVPVMEAELEVALRMQKSDKLFSVLNDLSKICLAVGLKEKALEYAHRREGLSQDHPSEPVSQTREEIREARKVDGLPADVSGPIEAKPAPVNLEQFSTEKTKIVLTGFMGTGKTTTGRVLADFLGYSFIDTDELIESRYGDSIAEIFRKFGEEEFRKMERGIVKEIGDKQGVVISTGGRLMLDPENVEVLSRQGRVFCLVATPDEILSRVSKDAAHVRPLLSVSNPKERIVELLQERNDKYRRFPQIATDQKEPTTIARNLIEFINTSPKSIVVENPHKNYEYVVGAGLLPFIRQLTGIEGEMVIITDEVVRALYGPSCAAIGPIIEIPAGRQHQSLATVQYVFEQLLAKGFDRTGSIIALGGSVVGNVAGYVAATFMRGVNFVQCPTSLIAMVDTSVGGKTSIDLPQVKNVVGIYKQPSKIIADVATLQTLPKLDFAAGMAEIVKYGLIAESDLLEQLEHGYLAQSWNQFPSNMGELQRLVAQAIQVKINIVQADPFEQGLRSTLNLGHTFAYAIEQVSNNTYRHGEAVGIGLVAAANLSARLGFCEASMQNRIETILKGLNLPTHIPVQLIPDALLQAMQTDKKKQAGRLRFILLSGIGRAFVSDEVPNVAVLETIAAMHASSAQP